MEMSNGTFTNKINRLFSLAGMERVIDRILRWEGVPEGKKSLAEVSRDLDISAQGLNNWKERDVPAREWPRLAKHYGRPIEVLTGAAPEDDSLLDELLAIWKVLIPETRRTVLGFAKFQRTIQNPYGETLPAVGVTPTSERDSAEE